MAHVRQSIRGNIVAALTGLATTGANVYASRVYPIADGNLPGLAIYTNDESISYQTMTPPRTLLREMVISVEAYVKGVANYDATIDNIIAEIESALFVDITRGGNARDTMIAGIDIEFSGDGDQPLARVTVSVQVEYITTEGSPSTSS